MRWLACSIKIVRYNLTPGRGRLLITINKENAALIVFRAVWGKGNSRYDINFRFALMTSIVFFVIGTLIIVWPHCNSVISLRDYGSAIAGFYALAAGMAAYAATV